MENRFQHIFLNLKGTSKNSNFFVRARKRRAENHSVHGVHEDSSTELTPLSREKCIFRGALKLVFACLLLIANHAWAQDEQKPSSDNQNESETINNEIFELGVAVGVINIADFNGEFTTGVSATFRASEDFFLQYNLLQAEASASAYERSQGKLFDGGDRTFLHYDLLVGYNIFQGEFFPSGTKARLAALYLVGGVGDTQFGGEGSFTYTVGVGYQIALTRRLILRVDYRNYLYTSNLIADENKSVNSTQFSSGLSFLF